MILTGKEIKRQVKKGDIDIFPFYKNSVNPNSYDFSLSSDPMLMLTGGVDTQEAPKYAKIPFDEDQRITLHPGNLYLARTYESIGSDKFVPMIEGRSSIGRIGVFIHVTAGFGDIGYKGQWTLEIIVTNSTVLHVGDRIGQVYFHTAKGKKKLYNGRYQGGEKMESKINE